MLLISVSGNKNLTGVLVIDSHDSGVGCFRQHSTKNIEASTSPSWFCILIGL